MAQTITKGVKALLAEANKVVTTVSIEEAQALLDRAAPATEQPVAGSLHNLAALRAARLGRYGVGLGNRAAAPRPDHQRPPS